MSFDSGLPGTPAEVWTGDGRLASLPPLGLDTSDRVIVVAAHPDDETLGAGGLIAECFANSIPVDVVIVTDGAASHPDSPTVSTAQLIARRAAEVRTAIEILAPGSAVTLLGFPDGAVLENRDRVHDALAVVLQNSPGTNLLASTWRGDGHRDHRVVGEICANLAAMSGIRLIEYPVWMWHWSTPDNAKTPWPTLRSLALRPASVAAKRRAIAAYESQTTPLSSLAGDEAVLHPRFLRHFGRTNEVFVTTASSGPGDPAGVPVPPEFAHLRPGTPANPVVPAPSIGTVEAAGSPGQPGAGDAHGGAGPGNSMPGSYFDDTYSHRADPWGFETRWYESRKRALTLAALPSQRYDTALEIGCSIGVLTEQLAPRCGALLAVDISQAAVDRARIRLAESSHVRIERADIGVRFPDRHFDLVLLSEVGYYFDLAGLAGVLDHIEDALGDTGVLVACHWRHPVADYPLRGDDVHTAIRERPSLQRLAVHVEEDFVLEVFSRDSRSVAERTGLL